MSQYVYTNVLKNTSIKSSKHLQSADSLQIATN